jgi:hypothetical protein
MNIDSSAGLGDAKASSSLTSLVTIGASVAAAFGLMVLALFFYNRRAARQKVIPSTASKSPKVQPEHLPTLSELKSDAVYKIHPEDINFDVSDDSDDDDSDNEFQPPDSVVRVLPVHPSDDRKDYSGDDGDDDDIEHAHKI